METDSELTIINCIEKPETIINNIKGTGFSIFSGETQKIIKEVYEFKSEKLDDLCDCFNYLVASGRRGLAITIAKKEFNINTISDLTETESFLNN